MTLIRNKTERNEVLTQCPSEEPVKESRRGFKIDGASNSNTSSRLNPAIKSTARPEHRYLHVTSSSNRSSFTSRNGCHLRVNNLASVVLRKNQNPAMNFTSISHIIPFSHLNVTIVITALLCGSYPRHAESL